MKFRDLSIEKCKKWAVLGGIKPFTKMWIFNQASSFGKMDFVNWRISSSQKTFDNPRLRQFYWPSQKTRVVWIFWENWSNSRWKGSKQVVVFTADTAIWSSCAEKLFSFPSKFDFKKMATYQILGVDRSKFLGRLDISSNSRGTRTSTRK